jgi:hypothetical protein
MGRKMLNWATLMNLVMNLQFQESLPLQCDAASLDERFAESLTISSITFTYSDNRKGTLRFPEGTENCRHS